MYTKQNKIITSKEEITNYVEGIDIFNSKFLYELRKPELNREVYTVTIYEYRPDLIAQDFYGDVKYEGILMLQVGRLENLVRGNRILLVSRSDVNSILSRI